jgi:lipid-A-disaccharide synthase
MKTGAKKIFMIAGEPSGDSLGGALIAALRAQSTDPLVIEGVGGDLMQAQGLKSLLPMSEICVMGLFEVVAQLPRLIKLINAMVEEIETRQPDVFLTIDLPDFNFEIGKRLKKRGIFKGQHIHYVAPTVWAWRPGRAKKIAAFLDGLICLYPFEPDYFTKHNLKAVYAGHPMVEKAIDKADGTAFKAEYDIPPDALSLGVLFGSRIAEFESMSRILTRSIQTIKEIHPNLVLIIPTLPHLEYEILQIISAIDCPAYVVTNTDSKWDAFKAMDLAVAVSGTVGLELAYAGTPHVIAYRLNPLSWLALKAMVKVKYAHLANLLLNELIVPEFLQWNATPLKISTELLRLIKLPSLRQQQKDKFQCLRQVMGADAAQTPSQRAAEFVLQLFNGCHR